MIRMPCNMYNNLHKSLFIRDNCLIKFMINRSRTMYTKRSNLYIPTIKETPSDAELKSHRLLLRGGFIRKSGYGTFMYLPLALRSLEKIEHLIDHHMQSAQCIKMSMPCLLSADLWKQSGRWKSSGPELIRLKDRRNEEWCLGPTHEEAFTSLIKSTISSYRHLPLRLYQIGRKFRDEIRPRFGLLRSKEFIMKDAYTFDSSPEDAIITYKIMGDAYHNFFKQLQVPYVAVEADTGNIGGNLSHEFHILSNRGEDGILSCSSCGYAASSEKTISITKFPSDHKFDIPSSNELTSHENIVEILRNGLITHDVNNSNIRSVVFYDKNIMKSPILVVVQGGRDVNEVALHPFLPSDFIPDELPHAMEINQILSQVENIPNISWTILVDRNLDHLSKKNNFLNNLLSSHAKQPVVYGNFQIAKQGDFCPQCLKIHNEKKELKEERGIEVGHIFYLGTKYSKAMKAKFIGMDKKSCDIQMGCYGLGVSRILAGVVESLSDEKGIIWPSKIAPYQAVVLSAKKDFELDELAQKIAKKISIGVSYLHNEVVLDDRWDKNLGYKLKEADLVGYPWCVIIGNKAKEGLVEIQHRATGEKSFVDIKDIVSFFQNKQK